MEGVFLDKIPDDLTPIGYHESKKDQISSGWRPLRLAMITLGQRQRKDDGWVDRVYATLSGNWEHDTRGYIDVF